MADAASNGIYWVKYSQGNPGNAAHKHVRSFAVLLKQRAIRLFKEDSSTSLSLSPRLKSHPNLLRGGCRVWRGFGIAGRDVKFVFLEVAEMRSRTVKITKAILVVKVMR
jgi:hypothetical protein